MYVSIINQKGDVAPHKNINTNPDTFPGIVQPFRKDLLLGFEGMFTWDEF